MKLIRILISLLFLTSTKLAFGTWSKQADDNLKVRFGIIIPSYSFQVQAPSDISKEKAEFEPNVNSKTGLALSYRNLGVSLAAINAVSPEDRIKFGTTKSSDFQFRLFGKRTYEFFYQTYTGYYLKNSTELDSSYASSASKLLRSDISTRNFGLNFYWNFDDKDYSQAVAFDQNGMQKDSAWGLSWLVHLSESSIAGDRAFIPSASASKFGYLSTLSGIKRSSLASGLGLGGIASWENLYFSTFIGLGLGYQKYKLQISDPEKELSERIGTYSSLRFGLGYNGPKHLFGLQMLVDSVASPIGLGQISGSTIDALAFYAYRFDGVDMPLANGISKLLD